MANSKKTVVAIGKFDGVHSGHRELLLKATRIAEEKGYESVALVIDTQRGQLLIPKNERDEMIKSLGINRVEIKCLTPEFMNMSAEEFVSDFLIKELNCEYVVVGYNFRFAKGRSADANYLEELCMENDIYCTVIPKLTCHLESGEVTASSSNIRDSLFRGDVKEASVILGRTYSLSGEVVSGRKIGRTINTPTANIKCHAKTTLPKKGVYATRVQINGKTYASITNIGNNPTVSSNGEITIETHIIDFSDNIYGKEIKIEFLSRIRDEKKFDSLEELKNQIEKDINISKKE
ncbi:MAG: bifunctional riboflavin kinase/FAD synthetase [Clostridia bacterium]|nr:bifunctional riboflavin kinase/FAD synthetase [Clostridia bacterium]